MPKAPVLKRRVQGKKRYIWRCCPYCTNDSSERIPEGERVDHPTTSGHMALSVRAGHNGVVWVCEDTACSYYLGTATTSIKIPFSKVQIDRITGEYTILERYYEQPICTGTFFWEK